MVNSFKYHRMAEDGVDHGKRALICCIRTIITLVKFRQNIKQFYQALAQHAE